MCVFASVTSHRDGYLNSLITACSCRRAIACNACETIQRTYRGYVGRLTATFLRDLQAKIIISQACAPQNILLYSCSIRTPSLLPHTALPPHPILCCPAHSSVFCAGEGNVRVSLWCATSSVSCQRKSSRNQDNKTTRLCMRTVSTKPTLPPFVPFFIPRGDGVSCKSVELGSLPRIQATKAVREVGAREAPSGYQLAEDRTRSSRPQTDAVHTPGYSSWALFSLPLSS